MGVVTTQAEGYKAFIPKDLPPDPPVDTGTELLEVLSEADRSLGRLDGLGGLLPHPDLFVAMYVRREAVLSSQIEGIQSSLTEVLQFEVDGSLREKPKDVEEVVNYVRAMNHGLRRLEEIPLSLRLVKEVHEVLLDGVRGSHLECGEFRHSQNWIGPAGCTLKSAVFVPPPPHEMVKAMGELEKFLHDLHSLPPLIHCGLVHAQFETIHPFLDGNGRIGRLLITLMLCEKGVLKLPMLYLSHYLKRNRAEYYDRLMAVRMRGQWEEWLLFFLKGIDEVAREAAETARAVLDLRERDRATISQSLKQPARALNTLDYLLKQPITTAQLLAEALSCAPVTSGKVLADLCKLGILVETTGGRRNRRFSYEQYRLLFENES